MPLITHHYFIDDGGVVHLGVRDGLLTVTKCYVVGTLDGYVFKSARPLTQYPLNPPRVVTCITCVYRSRYWFP